MTGAVKVRQAHKADADHIALLTRELGYPASTGEIAERLVALLEMDDRWVAVAIDSERRVLGWVAVEQRLLLESGKKAEIVGLIVSHAVRRTGIGQALVAEAERWALARRLSFIGVKSNANRKESHIFYQNLGYLYQKTQHNYIKTL